MKKLQLQIKDKQAQTTTFFLINEELFNVIHLRFFYVTMTLMEVIYITLIS